MTPEVTDAGSKHFRVTGEQSQKKSKHTSCIFPCFPRTHVCCRKLSGAKKHLFLNFLILIFVRGYLSSCWEIITQHARRYTLQANPCINFFMLKETAVMTSQGVIFRTDVVRDFYRDPYNSRAPQKEPTTHTQRRLRPTHVSHPFLFQPPTSGDHGALDAWHRPRCHPP